MQTIYVIRYMWKFKDDDKVYYKIISDLAEGLKAFEDSLIKLSNLERATREYLHEFNCEKLGVIDKLIDFSIVDEPEVTKNEKI